VKIIGDITAQISLINMLMPANENVDIPQTIVARKRISLED